MEAKRNEVALENSESLMVFMSQQQQQFKAAMTQQNQMFLGLIEKLTPK